MRVAAFLTLLLLAAGNAFAHGGHADERQGAAAPEQAAQVFSAPCGELPGHVCSCGNLALCSGAAKPVAIAGAFACFSLAAAATRPLGGRAPQPSSSPTYRAPARAPPLFS